jgi:hypothetical protein
VVSVSLKYAAHPRSTGFNIWIVFSTDRPRAPYGQGVGR